MTLILLFQRLKTKYDFIFLVLDDTKLNIYILFGEKNPKSLWIRGHAMDIFHYLLTFYRTNQLIKNKISRLIANEINIFSPYFAYVLAFHLEENKR